MTRNTVIILLIGLLIAGGGAYVALSGDSSEATGTTPVVETGTKADWPAKRAEPVPASHDNGIAVLGFADAPVTVIEYASMTCGHCAHFHTDSLPGIKEKYVDTGLVKFEFRPFPLDIWAARASMIASCGGDKYFAFADLLFRRQAQWISNDEQKIRSELESIAAIGGMGKDAVDQCLTDEALFQRIVEIRQEGEKTHKVNSTPTLIIDGKNYTGVMSVKEFSDAVDPLLKDALN